MLHYTQKNTSVLGMQEIAATLNDMVSLGVKDLHYGQPSLSLACCIF